MKFFIGLLAYYIVLCILKVALSNSGSSAQQIIDALHGSGPYVAALVALLIAVLNGKKPKPKLKFAIADKVPLQQIMTRNGQNVTLYMMRLICTNDSDVLAEDVSIELTSIGIPSPLNWTHQNPSNGISKCYDLRNILPHQKAYFDLLQSDFTGNFYFASHPISGTHLAQVAQGVNQKIEMVYNTKNGTNGKISVVLDNYGSGSPQTVLKDLLQD